MRVAKKQDEVVIQAGFCGTQLRIMTVEMFRCKLLNLVNFQRSVYFFFSLLKF